MATIRNLSFRSRDLGDDVSLMLCFTPPGPDLYKNQFPVAWKVTTLGARGGAVLNATWISTLSVCSAQVEGAGNYVNSGTYIPIAPGQITTLQRVPGGYEWSEPENIGGTVIRAKNGTDGPIGIGAGFITDEGTNRENMNTAVVYDRVGSGLTVNAQFTPILSAYVALGYRENQLVKSEIIGVDPIWQSNLLGLSESTTIWIRKTAGGGYIAEQTLTGQGFADDRDVPDIRSLGIGEESPDPLQGIDLSFGATRMFRATLAFSSSSIINNLLQALTKELLSKGYNVKIVSQKGERDVCIELVLPTNTSCYQAEKAILGCVRITQVPLPIAIKERSGEIMKFSAGHMSRWCDINPASVEWYITKQPGPVELIPSGNNLSAMIENGVPSSIASSLVNGVAA